MADDQAWVSIDLGTPDRAMARRVLDDARRGRSPLEEDRFPEFAGRLSHLRERHFADTLPLDIGDGTPGGGQALAEVSSAVRRLQRKLERYHRDGLPNLDRLEEMARRHDEDRQRRAGQLALEIRKEVRRQRSSTLDAAERHMAVERISRLRREASEIDQDRRFFDGHGAEGTLRLLYRACRLSSGWTEEALQGVVSPSVV